MKKNGFAPILVLIIALIAVVVIIFSFKTNTQNLDLLTPRISPTPIAHYLPPTLQKSKAYTIVFVGDSMVDSLGENFDYLRQDLEAYFPDTVFGIFNYGYGATNILSLPERLSSETTYRDKTNEAILDRFMDIIIIGSFGHNPLSDFSLEEGLKKQTEVLDEIVLQLVTQKPNTLIVFLAEFAPLEDDYARGVVELNSEQRSAWVNERKAYIKNHIDYATSHNIPLINVYEESLVEGDVDPDYISKEDYIHPSAAGLIFMSQAIADFLYDSSILP